MNGEPRLPPGEEYDPETWLEDDEKIVLANLRAGVYRVRQLGPDGQLHDVEPNEFGLQTLA